jgi:predicted GNAT superfamily acetyltransferase
MPKEIEIRECDTIDEMAACVELQREVFALPEIELSPVRHLIVTKNAGGFVLGAYAGDELVGFVLSVPAFLRGERAFYSHMTAVKADLQSYGIGARLKWAQRDRSLAEGVKYVKWTFEPWKARNAFFNLEKLGAVVREIQENFYGIDYATYGAEKIGLASDRLFAEWDLESEKVTRLAASESDSDTRKPRSSIATVNDWFALVGGDPERAVAEQLRLRKEFQDAFLSGLVAAGFERDANEPRYLLFSDEDARV